MASTQPHHCGLRARESSRRDVRQTRAGHRLPPPSVLWGLLVAVPCWFSVLTRVYLSQTEGVPGRQVSGARETGSFAFPWTCLSFYVTFYFSVALDTSSIMSA